jgi:dolichyl-phosphate-mannose--protein O-mannosyl transferase
LIIPPLVYLATYIPLFATGHSWGIFIEMQKQMWWYHTNLEATHPYTSPWWNWPLLVRPIYLYTSDEIGGWVARIYAMGNPIVFWGGIVSLISLGYWALEKRLKGILSSEIKNVALIIFSYLIFFVPWAASPRIMFLYHYLPSLPFLSIATAYLLRRNIKLAFTLLPIGLLTFLYFYPHWAGLKIPLWLDSSYYWFTSWR